MTRRNRRRSVRISVAQGLAGAALVAAGLAGGAWAGMDAAAQVDARYRAAPEFRLSVPLPAPVSRWEPAVAEQASIAAPPAGSVWGQEIGRDERAFFDPAIGEEPPKVRVHRERRRADGWDDASATVAAPVDEWADPPVEAEESFAG